MKITLNQDPAYGETEIIINCPQADEDILRLVAMLRIHQRKLVGTLEGEQYLLDARDILYIDTADKRTFSFVSLSLIRGGKTAVLTARFQRCRLRFFRSQECGTMDV